jgi:ABC transport system ATP-binding/permease protein
MHRGSFYRDLAVFVGSGDTCQIVVSAPDVSRTHAVLRRDGDRLFVSDAGSQAGTYVNGKRLKAKRWIEITRDDEVRLGQTSLLIPEWLFLGRAAVSLQASSLRKYLGDGTGPESRVLCDADRIVAPARTLTAIIGPSGSGKSILLSLLSGYANPDRGRVLLSEEPQSREDGETHAFDLHRNHALVRDIVGYVTQDDLTIPELTVRESLNYRLCLSYPTMKPNVRTRLIEETCTRLGFLDENRRKTFLDTPIGSAQSKYRGLSGGERKRANIALELVTRPLVLLLDEPTSGLSSVEATRMIDLLKELATKEELTIISALHQPSQRAYQQFDNLIVVSHGGVIAYCGPASTAPAVFEHLTGTPIEQQNSAEYVLDLLDNANTRERILQAPESTRNLLPDAVPLIDEPMSDSPEPVQQRSTTAHRFGDPVRQWWTLTRRNARVLSRDWMALALLFGQVPVIAALLICVFHSFALDTKEVDTFSRRVYRFGELKDPLEAQRKSVPVDRLWRESAAHAEGQLHLISDFGARNRACVLFLLAASSIWFGLFAACGEVVTEFHILRREVRSCVRLFPYLAAKLSFVVLITGVQTGLLVGLAVPALLSLPVYNSVQLWGVLWATATASAALGLLLSSVSGTYRFALTTVPLLLIPQLMFGGLLRPPVVIPEDYRLPSVLSRFTIQRWAFEATLAVDVFADGGVLKQQLFQKRFVERYDELNFLKYSQVTLPELLFGKRTSGRLLIPLEWLAGLSLAFFCAAYATLRYRLPTR